MAHPAKAHVGVLEWLIKRYTKEEDIVCDPMAGTGSTGLLACLFGRKSILVEYEGKFVEWSKRNIARLKGVKPDAKIAIIQGDSRFLSDLLRQHISKLQYGSIDAVITSPPYAESESHKRLPNLPTSQGGQTEYVPQKGGVSKFRYGSIDSIIFSPPFKTEERGSGIVKRWYTDKMKPEDYACIGFRDKSKSRSLLGFAKTSEDPSNIGNLPYGKVDSIITSPPYEGTTFTGSELIPPHDSTKLHLSEYAPSKENIGNLKGETYLEAMVRIYSECHKVLKPNGFMVLLVRPFIRNKRVVDLPHHTWLLCERVGFKLKEVLKLRLPSESFWRIIYHRKFPHVTHIVHEYALALQKRGAKSS